MEKRAKRILTQMPNHERKDIFFPFTDAVSSSQKQIKMNEKIAEMEKDGWIYLKASEANPLKTINYIGGGLNLHFIKKADDDNQSSL